MLIYIFIFLSINTNKQYRYIFPSWQFTIQTFSYLKTKSWKLLFFTFIPQMYQGMMRFLDMKWKKNVEYEKRMLKYMYIANLNTMQLSLKTEKMNFFYSCMYTKKKRREIPISHRNKVAWRWNNHVTWFILLHIWSISGLASWNGFMSLWVSVCSVWEESSLCCNILNLQEETYKTIYTVLVWTDM